MLSKARTLKNNKTRYIFLHYRIKMKTIINQLIQLRRERGVSLKAVAEALGTDTSFVCAVECGTDDRLTVRTLKGYMKALGSNLKITFDENELFKLEQELPSELTTLDQLKRLQSLRAAAFMKSERLYDKLVEEGIAWQELAVVSKIDAVKLCKQVEKVSLQEAMNKVNHYLET